MPSCSDDEEKSRLFKESRDATLDKAKDPLRGRGTYQFKRHVPAGA